MKSSKLRYVVMVAILLTAASPALAVKGPQNVSRTIHNMSTTPFTEAWDGVVPTGGMEGYATNETEVCIFCHTPHGGVLNGPLWNHQLPNPASFTHYNSSTLTAEVSNMARPVRDESLLCLSCHDGSIGTNRVLNPSNSNPTGQPDNIVSGAGLEIPIFTPARIGDSSPQTWTSGDLSDDHPISFSYDAAFGEESLPGGPNGLYDAGTAAGRGVRFFGTTGNYVECSSCHDPHVSYITALDAGANPDYAPFLITTNQGSYLCLSCHNK